MNVCCPKCGVVFGSSFRGRYKLSPREAQCADMVTRGLSNAEVAKRMATTENTLKVRLTSIFKKVGVRDRQQLMLVGLLGVDVMKKLREGS